MESSQFEVAVTCTRRNLNPSTDPIENFPASNGCAEIWKQVDREFTTQSATCLCESILILEVLPQESARHLYEASSLVTPSRNILAVVSGTDGLCESVPPAHDPDYRVINSREHDGR